MYAACISTLHLDHELRLAGDGALTLILTLTLTLTLILTVTLTLTPTLSLSRRWGAWARW